MDRRQSPRFADKGAYFCKAVIKRRGILSRYQQVRVRDISSSGVSIDSRTAFPFEESLVLVLEDIYGRKYRFIGKVTYSRQQPGDSKHFLVGLAFCPQRLRVPECNLLTRLGASCQQLRRLNCQAV